MSDVDNSSSAVEADSEERGTAYADSLRTVMFLCGGLILFYAWGATAGGWVGHRVAGSIVGAIAGIIIGAIASHRRRVDHSVQSP